jgi:hypothetical protein
MKERWKDIQGYENRYKVSNLGNVKSLSRKGKRQEHLLNLAINPKGYYYVCLCVDSKQRTFRVHRLVAEAFIPNPKNLPEVNHKWGNKKDNRACALEWCTTQFNIEHAFENNLKPRDKKGKFKKKLK